MKKYTKLWVGKFSTTDAEKYNRKWFEHWEKNFKHRQEIEVLRPLVKSTSSWLDFPVGSGRLFESLKGLEADRFGYDYSEQFLEFSKNKFGIYVQKNDLFKPEFHRKFKLITCFHVLQAFSGRENLGIIANLASGLSHNGKIVVTLANPRFPNTSENAIQNSSQIEQFLKTKLSKKEFMI